MDKIKIISASLAGLVLSFLAVQGGILFSVSGIIPHSFLSLVGSVVAAGSLVLFASVYGWRTSNSLIAKNTWMSFAVVFSIGFIVSSIFFYAILSGLPQDLG
ncbi:hypothetical protein EML15_08010 [Corynebacterium sp. sy017]|uniref:hypothetical protein n=1 Tax=unclassified Corynebacterium TaxID=2624378 RepID=UPI001184EE92|nr:MULTISPECIES: hypothetical protein [unclassified Corynebacterium]MBP3089087.1 hypothetical protein [Corynebacterium sp. sy017]TSD91402.1 hypothetical protein ELY17_08020 [Corynebacterium sp. SY003]